MKNLAVYFVVGMLVLMSACERGSSPGHLAPSSSPPDSVDQRVVGIYGSAIREFAETEKWFDQVLIDDSICPNAGNPTQANGEACTRLTQPEKDALLAELDDARARFVEHPDAVSRQIFKGKIEGAGLIAVGPIAGTGDRVEVPGHVYCGGLCGHWMTLVIERRASGWTVTGTTGPVGIS